MRHFVPRCDRMPRIDSPCRRASHREHPDGYIRLPSPWCHSSATPARNRAGEYRGSSTRMSSLA